MSVLVKTIGAYEAKTKLASLLDQVSEGKEVINTKRERAAGLCGYLEIGVAVLS